MIATVGNAAAVPAIHVLVGVAAGALVALGGGLPSVDAIAFVMVALNSALCVLATVIVLILAWINRAASSRLVVQRPLSVAVAMMIATVGDAAAVPAIHVLVGVAASAFPALAALPSIVARAAFGIACVVAFIATLAKPQEPTSMTVAIVPVAVARTAIVVVPVPAAHLAQDARRRHPQHHREDEYDHVPCCRRVSPAMHQSPLSAASRQPRDAAC
jgi:hypothetical protein